jgi:hypothetical protein
LLTNCTANHGARLDVHLRRTVAMPPVAQRLAVYRTSRVSAPRDKPSNSSATASVPWQALAYRLVRHVRFSAGSEAPAYPTTSSMAFFAATAAPNRASPLERAPWMAAYGYRGVAMWRCVDELAQWSRVGGPGVQLWRARAIATPVVLLGGPINRQRRRVKLLRFRPCPVACCGLRLRAGCRPCSIPFFAAIAAESPVKARACWPGGSQWRWLHGCGVVSGRLMQLCCPYERG